MTLDFVLHEQEPIKDKRLNVATVETEKVMTPINKSLLFIRGACRVVACQTVHHPLQKLYVLKVCLRAYVS